MSDTRKAFEQWMADNGADHEESRIESLSDAFDAGHDAATTWGESGPTEDQVSAALRVLRADYWTSICSLAEDVYRRVKAGEDEYDAIHETADGSSWVIYTGDAQQALLASEHDPWEDVADAGGMGDYPMAALAYFVVRHDLAELVDALRNTDDTEDT